ncbi:hypothetical protein [Lacrimispora sp.]|uniref:hypothetical protein n=1 Tax=Lacrimispora sp. TaxID=2719234 RepID=UPI0034603589
MDKLPSLPHKKGGADVPPENTGNYEKNFLSQNMLATSFLDGLSITPKYEENLTSL